MINESCLYRNAESLKFMKEGKEKVGGHLKNLGV